jgi:hypothetical protein
MIVNVTALLAEKTAAKGLELIVDVADDVPNELVGDPLRLGQVLINYANNAVKFTERGEVAIRVRRREAGTGRSSCIRGARHRHRHRPRRAGPAVQQLRAGRQLDHPPLRRHRPGAGDLAAAGRADGGEVGLNSTPGSARPSGSPRGWATARPSPRAVPHAELVGRPMLVVDDNAHAREVLGEMLRRMGFEVTALNPAPPRSTKSAAPRLPAGPTRWCCSTGRCPARTASPPPGRSAPAARDAAHRDGERPRA